MIDRRGKMTKVNTLGGAELANQNIGAGEIEITGPAGASRFVVLSGGFIRALIDAVDVNNGGAGCVLTIRVVNDRGGAGNDYEVWNEDVNVSAGETISEKISSNSMPVSAGDEIGAYITSSDALDVTSDISVEFIRANP